ncbi:hypothetical protein N9P38_02075 [Flavobacteriales bacterium]|nr:hypothetical protein [Flavobacteriales bacterium]MDB4088676.1 hypothetical protein [Flavobacteriales bacterium]
MPIRIRKDKNTDRGNNTPNRPTNNNTGGGGGGLIAFAPLLFGLFKKKPKLVLAIAAIGAVVLEIDKR